MSGIFNYQVPGQKPQVNQPEMSSSTTNQFNQNSSQSFQQAPGFSFNIQQLVSLLQQLLQQLNSHSDNTPPSEGTTQALGEEDGGRPPSEKPCNKPPEATTNALGEEDGGRPPSDNPSPKPPTDATTLALGEEDGGRPPIDKPSPTPPTDVTTRALGEEDGGRPPIDNPSPKPPTDFTTLALGEEDGGRPPIDRPSPTPTTDVTTKALGEEDGGRPPIDKPPTDVTTLALGEEDGGFGPIDPKPPTNNPDGKVPADFTANQEKWQSISNEPGASISYTTQQNSFSLPDFVRPMNITESNGQITSATYADTGEPVPDNVRQSLKTVDERFEQLKDAYENGADRVDVTYDSQFGFPTSAFIDRDFRIADEEFGFTITNLGVAIP